MTNTDTRHADWFAHSVFYEVLVGSFADANGDGTGDLAGLASKLDYLRWLGVDCLWLLPFFPSPLADGGYDVAAYTDVAPRFGTLADFDDLIAAAHERGLHVIIDFVLNHTSAEHPWFQASRTDPAGPYGDFYVWRDDDTEFADARIIFLDTEASNWSFDEVRGQYYWHRFFAHQPDLNFDNPRVVEEMLAALRFWLERGVDGFRLDAVPYLVERPGTNGENLPETHAILKRIRALVDAEFPHAILLCEANQWPAEVVEYFGAGDECHLAFNFPVMPRLYMGLRRADRTCICDILAATPAIPPGCQWGTFLRNHDELTLEMVTPAERDWMWQQYAPDERMKSNLGIRRRLAPLMDDDPQRIRLLHAMLLALPGSPVLYYGDEIGMGDNIWLNDRDGVRTPMQWTGDDARAGFSTADPAAFDFPVIGDEAYRPSRVNVADQARDPGSLLSWLRGALAIRRASRALTEGGFADLGGVNPAVLAVAREHAGERVVAVFNLSADPQSCPSVAGAGTDLLTARGVDLAELTLPPHGFVWVRTS